jgi:hypothetical protein
LELEKSVVGRKYEEECEPSVLLETIILLMRKDFEEIY